MIFGVPRLGILVGIHNLIRNWSQCILSRADWAPTSASDGANRCESGPGREPVLADKEWEVGGRA
jgi:hypothetical protein